MAQKVYLNLQANISQDVATKLITLTILTVLEVGRRGAATRAA